MTRRSPYVIELSAVDRAALEQRARAYTAPYHQVMRAKIVLLAADGLENTVIADRLDVAVQLVSKWRKRFYAEGLHGLEDRPRTGRPPAFSPCGGGDVKALACELPAETGVPLSRWSAPDLAVEAVARGIVESISASTVRRWLASDALKPWQHRSWIFPRDPDFTAKAARALDLYAGIWTANSWARTSSWSARTRKPRSRPAAAATPPCPPGRPE